jgi:hypothetical protein
MIDVSHADSQLSQMQHGLNDSVSWYSIMPA